MRTYVYKGVSYKNLFEIRQLLPNISLPREPTDEQIAELGITIKYVDPPESTPEELAAIEEAERQQQLNAEAQEFLLGIMEGMKNEQ